ncbi:MAG: hypothetical protein HXX16_17310 [Bacteroidales bacterium]|nr:hypothetical protein [Bacteroidales bacterium]
MKFLLEQLIELLKKADKKTLLIIVFSIPLIMVGYYRYTELTLKLSAIDSTLNKIQIDITKQTETNREVKGYIDSSVKFLKTEIIESVGSQLKYQLIYQNQLNQKAIIDQLEMWVKYNAKYGELIKNYKIYSDSIFYRP